MKTEYIHISGIPAILWGKRSDKLFLFVHDVGSSKESAEGFALIAAEYGYMTLSFDLPGSGDRANICSACVIEPCDLWHASRDLEIVRSYARNLGSLSLYAKGKGAEFSAAAFEKGAFDICVIESPELPADAFKKLGNRVSVGHPSAFDLESFVRSSI